MAGFKDLIVKIGADTKGLNKGVDAATGKLSSFGDKATSVGSSLAMSLTAPIAAVGAGILYTAGQFEASMNKMQGISGVTGAAFDGLRNKAKELGASTSFSASEAAQGMIALSQAGLNADQVMAGIEGTLQLAAAGGLELGEASGIAANAMAQFGLDASQVDRVANAMAATASSSTTNIQELAQGLKFGGLAAASAGLSFEEASAALGILANKGMAGSTSGERLRAVLGTLAKPSGVAAEALKQVHLAAADLDVQARGLPAVLDSLKNANLTTAQAISLFGIEAKDAAMALVDAGGTGFADFTAKLTGTDAAAVQAAANMKGFEGAMKALASATEALALVIAESGLLEWATGLVVKFTDIVRSIATTSPELLRVGVVIAGVAAAIGPVIFVLGTLASSWAALTPIVASAAAMLTGIPAAVAGIPAALGGVGAAATAAKTAVLGLGVTAATVAGGAAAAFAAWHLGKWAADNIPPVTWLGDAMADLLMQAAALAGLDLTGQQTAMGDLAKQANALSADLAKQGVVVARNGKSLQDWNKDLMAAASELVNTKKAAGDYKNQLDKTSDGTDGLDAKTRAMIEAMNNAAKSTDDLKTDVFDLDRAMRGLETTNKEAERIAKAAAIALAQDMGGAAVDLKVDVDAVNAATVAAMNSIAGWTQTAATAWDATAAKASATANSVDAAFKAMGLSTKSQLEQAATDAETNFDLIAGSGQASAAAIDAAWIQMLEARKAALIANGQDLGTEEQKILDDLKRRQGQHAADTKTIWSTWADGLKGVVNNLDIGGKIFAGDFAPGRWKETLKGIAGDFVNVFIQPLKDAINDFIATGLKKLTDALFGVGEQVDGLFGGGGGGGGTGPSGGGDSGGGGWASGLGGSAGGDPVQWALEATGIILDLARGKRHGEKLTLIEENTRFQVLLFDQFMQQVGFFQNDEMQKQTGNLEYIVANGDDMKSSLWSIRDLLSGGIAISGLTGAGHSDVTSAVEDGATQAGGALTAPMGSRTGAPDGTAGPTGQFSGPNNSRTAQIGVGGNGGTFSAPLGSRTGQRADAQIIADTIRETLEARNPLAVLAAQLGNPLAQLATGSNFLPDAVAAQTEAIEAQTQADAAQTSAITTTGNDTVYHLQGIQSRLDQFIATVHELLSREIVINIDNQEIARAVGAGTESLRATA